jgi:ribosomal protein S20
MFGNFFTKRIAISAAAFAVVAVAGIATVSIIPALASGVTGANGSTLAATPAPGGAASGHSGTKAVAAGRIALALYRESVKATGLSRTTVLKDLLNGETFAQIDGSKAQAVESAVMAKLTKRIDKAVTKGTITKTQAAALTSAATAGITKLMNMNLSTDIRVRFGGLATSPSTSTPSSPAAVTASSAAL